MPFGPKLPCVGFERGRFLSLFMPGNCWLTAWKPRNKALICQCLGMTLFALFMFWMFQRAVERQIRGRVIGLWCVSPSHGEMGTSGRCGMHLYWPWCR